MRIHAINAFEGDSLLLESTAPIPAFALIDAGPRGTYEKHVRAYLQRKVGDGGAIEAVIVSHVDMDHIAGVLDLVADVERAKVDGDPEPFKILDLWHNSFAATIDDDRGTVAAGIREMATLAGRAQLTLGETSIALLGIREGALLRRHALKLGIPINGAFSGEVISPDELTSSEWTLGDIKLQIIGPTNANLVELRTKWKKWINDNLEAFAEGDRRAMANADDSIPNLSSIVILATSPQGSALLTGDARGDHILQGLEAAGLLDTQSCLHVNVLKLQHHGSERNVTPKFFEQITADLYLVSADGKHGNPDFNTLKWLVEAAHKQGRNPDIVCTNRTASTDRLLAELPDDQFGYRLHLRAENEDAIILDLTRNPVI